MKRYWNEMKSRLDDIYCALADDESKEWFDARVEYMVDMDGNKYIEKIFELNNVFPKTWRCPEIERVKKNNQKIIIYGCGHDGKIIKKALEICGYSVWCWCDSNRELEGTQIEGKSVIAPEGLLPEYKDSLLIIGSKKYEAEIRLRLYDVGFPAENTFVFVLYPWIGTCGNQYFDVFPPMKKEIYVDVGAYNGDSVEEFLKWGGGCHKIYAIEPLADMCDVIERKRLPNVNVINCAAWNKNEKLYFEESMIGSCIVDSGRKIVQGRTIDSIINEDKVTFIKMDIEGAELKALEGARETIIKYHPRLAICIYHRPMDIYEIGKYILEMNPNYKLYIRHYTTCIWETVLYAV